MGIAEELRWTAAKLVNVGKFAVDSSVNESLLKGGMQVYAVVKGKLKDSNNYNKKQNSVVVEEMQANLEKMQQEQSNIIQIEEQLEHLKQFSEDPLKSPTPESIPRRKIFIRSRL